LLLNQADPAIELLIKSRAANPWQWVTHFGLAGALGLKGDTMGRRRRLPSRSRSNRRSTRSPDSVTSAPGAILSTGRSTPKRRRLACAGLVSPTSDRDRSRRQRRGTASDPDRTPPGIRFVSVAQAGCYHLIGRRAAMGIGRVGGITKFRCHRSERSPGTAGVDRRLRWRSRAFCDPGILKLRLQTPAGIGSAS
jgi:hypothetical protein